VTIEPSHPRSTEARHTEDFDRRALSAAIFVSRSTLGRQ
jgi:hypothetical protein